MPSRVDSRPKLGREVRIRRVDVVSIIAVAFPFHRVLLDRKHERRRHNKGLDASKNLWPRMASIKLYNF